MGLKQVIWDAKRETPDAWKLRINVFGLETRETWIKYTWFHRFKAFQVAFLGKALLLLFASISTNNKIYCKTEKYIETHAYASFIFSKSSITGNITMFKDLNVNQIGRKKTIPNRMTGWLFDGMIWKLRYKC